MPAAQLCELSAGRLRLAFAWERDRYRHTISLVDDAAPPTPLVLSLEGAPDELWPASPVLQELHVEPRPDGQAVALLVGRAGRSHWSLSVLADPERNELLFEAACRCDGHPEWLGSRYLVPDRAIISAAPEVIAADDIDTRSTVGAGDPGPLVCIAPASSERGWRLWPRPVPSDAANESTAGAPALAIAANWSGESARRTIEWRYRVWMPSGAADLRS